MINYLLSSWMIPLLDSFDKHLHVPEFELKLFLLYNDDDSFIKHYIFCCTHNMLDIGIVRKMRHETLVGSHYSQAINRR